MEEILKNLGLSSNEVEIYKFLLLEGPNLAGAVSKKTGIHRRNIYDILERLIEKGFVSYIKENNKRYYEANNPEFVLNRLNQRVEDWKTLVPDIKKQMSQWKDKKETLFFRGVEGVKHIFLDQINVGKEILVHATSSDIQRVVRFFLPKYQLLREENNIHTRMLLDSVSKKDKHYFTIKNLPLCSAKFLDNYNTTYTSEYIYGDNTAIVVWSDFPFAILTRHPEIAKANRERFELLWKIGEDLK